jgi:hypothetical protein
MPTPVERLEERKRLADCRVCAWLATLSEKDRKEWQAAVMNPRFGASLVASEIGVEIASRDVAGSEVVYSGPSIGEASVQTHRQRGHR